VVELVMRLPRTTPAEVVCLRGNHEDGWLRVCERGWPEFVLRGANGCWDTLRSYVGSPAPGKLPTRAEWDALTTGSFFPPEHLEWMRGLRLWHEDEHAVYVHAGLPLEDGRFLHPREVVDSKPLLWQRSGAFFRDYQGKRVVCGHTPTDTLPEELSTHTPEDPADVWLRGSVVAVDTGCGTGGFLTAVELPSLRVHESR
jgi:serine/threonine protein phosphatase 1